MSIPRLYRWFTAVEQALAGAASKPLVAVRDKARAEATRLAAPCSIALMGEPNSGKSYVGSGLAVRPGLFPSLNVPLTGNITRARLLPGAANSPPVLRSRVVRFFGRQEAFELFAKVARAVGELARDGGLPEAVMKEFEKIDPTSPNSRPLFEKWVEVAWAAQGGPKIRLSLRELYRFCAALDACPSAWFGKACIADDEVARLAVELAHSPPLARMTFEELKAEARSLVFPSPGADRPDSLTIQAVFPLVEDVFIECEVDPEKWSVLAESAPAPVELLDLPGTGEGAWGLRNRTIRQRLFLKGPMTVVIVHKANDPAELVGSVVLQEMRNAWRDADGRPLPGVERHVISVVNRFDEALNNDGAGKELDDLIGTQQPSLPEARVRTGMRGLWCLVGANRELTGQRAENAFFTSALLGQYLLGAELKPDEQQVCDRTFQRDLPRWRRLGRLLLAGKPDSDLGRWLLAFAGGDSHESSEEDDQTAALMAEGGLWRLRERLQQHVRETALAPRLHAASAEAAALDLQLADPGKVGEDTGKGPGGMAPSGDINRRIHAAKEKLGLLINDAIELAAKFPAHLRCVNLPDDLESPPPENTNVALRDLFIAETVYRFWHGVDWRPIWEGLLTEVKNDYIPAGGPEDARNPYAPKLKKRTDELFPPFRDLYRAVVTMADACIEEALKQYLGEMAARLGGFRSDLERLLAHPDFQRSPTGGPSPLAVFIRLKESESFDWFLARIKDKAPPTPLEEQDINDRFPLANAGGGLPGRSLPWSSDRNQDTNKPYRHQFIIARLRFELIASVQDAVLRLIAARRDHYAKQLEDEVRGLTRELADLRSRANTAKWKEFVSAIADPAPVAAPVASGVKLPRLADFV